LGLAVELTLDFRRDCPTDFVKAEVITKAVKTMMEQDGELRNKAKETSEMAKKAVMEGGSSYVAFGNLIDQWLGCKPGRAQALSTMLIPSMIINSYCGLISFLKLN
jgi:hypothetical protein